MFKFFRKKKTDNQTIIPPAGRSSKEEPSNILQSMAGWMSYFDGISPVIPWDYLEFLIKVAMINPDISHAVKNWINLANNGHNLIIEAANDRIIQKAQDRLNQKAVSLYERSGGVDGLINHYLYQIAVTGALSSEDVIEANRNGVKHIAIVPVRKIRFRYEQDEYQPYYLTNEGELLQLNPYTYAYYAYQVIENSPYAKPPILAAIEPVLMQRDAMDNMKYILRKLGLLGLVALTLKKMTKQPNETDEELRKRMQNYASQVMDSLKKNFNKGLMVKFEDQTLEHFNITGEARGAKDIFTLLEEQMASGIGVDSSVLGRSYHTTETFANVMYMFMVRDANNFRRLVKRRMEKTYRLDLLLAGIPVNDVTLNFNPNPARDPQSEAQAEQIHTNNVIKKVQVGLIDPDTGAQELGYDQWFDPELINGLNAGPLPVFGQRKLKRIKLVFNKANERYEFNRPRIFLRTERAEEQNLTAEEAVRKRVEQFANSYLKNMRQFLNKGREQAIKDVVDFIRKSDFGEFMGADDFAERMYLFFAERYPSVFKGLKSKQAIKRDAQRIYETYRLRDKSAFKKAPEISFTMDAIDKKTVDFISNLDNFYLSKFIHNHNVKSSFHSFLKDQFLEKGEGLFDRTSDSVLGEFQQLLKERAVEIEDWAAKRIINTSVQRMRSWAQIGQLNEAGFEYAEIYNPSPEAEICVYMNGKIIPIGPAREAVGRFAQMTPEEFEGNLHPITPSLIESKGVEQATADGEGFPPYHPNCHTRVIAYESDSGSESRIMDANSIERFLAHFDDHSHRNIPGAQNRQFTRFKRVLNTSPLKVPGNGRH